jgi:hypothetical protein
MEEIIYRNSETCWNCPICDAHYTEETFPSLQRHCNRLHKKRLRKTTTNQAKNNSINRIINNRKSNKQQYRIQSAKNICKTNTQIYKCKHKNHKGTDCKLKAIGRAVCHYHQRKTEQDAKKYGNYTENNQNNNSHIKIQKSTLPDKINKTNQIVFASGNGVFTTKAYQKGDYITEYCGDFVTMEQFAQNQFDRFYFLQVPKTFNLAGINGLTSPMEGKGVGSFINRGYESSAKKHKNFRNNVYIKYNVADKTVWIVARNFLSKTSELFLNYGKEYNMNSCCQVSCK